MSYRSEILDHLAKERSYYKEETVEIRIRRNEMYRKTSTDEWDEINESYKTALFLKLLDIMVDKCPNIPVEELYAELQDLELSEFFEPSN